VVTAGILNRVDIPEAERKQIEALYRQAVTTGCRAQLIGPTGESHGLPEPVYRLIVQILENLSRGESVAILQDGRGLTTVQASKFLGVSRQFLVNLLENGEIRYHKVGSHRRVYLRDLMAYEEARNKKRHGILRQMAQDAVSDGSYDIVPDNDFAGE
jgi:excisionase family DNA binding protein